MSRDRSFQFPHRPSELFGNVVTEYGSQKEAVAGKRICARQALKLGGFLLGVQKTACWPSMKIFEQARTPTCIVERPQR